MMLRASCTCISGWPRYFTVAGEIRMVMSCAALLEKNPSPTLDDVKAATSGHLCRCGTYPHVFAATLDAAAVRTG